ncbi:MAG TPA: peptidase S10 [Vicinamibacteria bacterium]|nr:peptidase S10 [Vicinamibacteria bacterium]
MLLSLSILLALAPQASPAPAAARASARAQASPSPAAPDEPGDDSVPTPAPAAKGDAPKEREGHAKEVAPVVTRHEARVGGRVLRYTVTTGLMPLKNEAGETEASIFYMAYVADRTSGVEKRPLTFSFNGGPGSASVWLHLGAIGPKRVRMLEEGGMPAPPYELVDNEATWLDLTDLVFIDPVGTGYSRAKKPELGHKFWSVDGDIQSVGEFIRLYLSRAERWGSPLFLVGESYGTTRAAGLSGYLVERGIALNGVMLVSSVLNFQTNRFTRGNDTPYPLYLPTYTATAWYHRKLPPDLQQQPLRKVLDEVEQWAAVDYPAALARGDRLAGAERTAVVERLARYTGLSRDFVDQSDLRIEIQHFCKELMRDRKRTVGRLDSRFEGIDPTAAGERPDYDPSLAAIRPPYTAMFNDYVRRTLGYKSDLTYYILGGGVGNWDYGSANGFADVSESLRSAFAKNPAMRLFVASGYYDLATPYFATDYTLTHLGLDPSQRARVTTSQYQAGHMMYISTRELARLKADVAAFVQSSLAAPAPGDLAPSAKD